MNYLRSKEPHIPFNDYGEEHYKPCLYPLFSVKELTYVVYITSPKSKHRHMGTSRDFKKVFIDTNKRKGRYYVGAINLNHMFPVPSKFISDFKFANIDSIRSFKNPKEKSKYISLLKHELKSVEIMDISQAAVELYNYKYNKPQSPTSKRCFDFKKLEEYADEYVKNSLDEKC